MACKFKVGDKVVMVEEGISPSDYREPFVITEICKLNYTNRWVVKLPGDRGYLDDGWFVLA